MSDNATAPISVIANYACKTGENPLWHPLEKQLYWTDIPTGRLFRYDPAAHKHEKIYEDRPVGGFTFQPDGALLLFRDKGNVVIWRDGEERQTVIEEIPDEATTRFNDVMADPEGRVFCGTMPTEDRLGRLYRLDPDGTHHLVVENVGIANGMGFTLDETGLYFTDSKARTIYLFDYDRRTGNITNQRPAIQTDEAHGLPDGMIVDEYGDIWSAHFGGHGIYRYNTATGQLKQKIELPARNVTSLTFAGDDLQDVYVTTALGSDKAEAGEHAGALLHFRAPVPGRHEFFSRIGV
ncbi:SMP-30/gluconolactonase/LRE family protein [Phycisphaerales bacterium AB-hyl4]|uniref:SMP-30/gluconolactonase/LRE family protein n=1 Tax=Natronomicrosphaera hydrolytica TaxID=3242702 RepID=A0ABV4U5P9_9BACT